MIIAAYSNSSWKRMESAVNSFKECIPAASDFLFVPEQCHIDKFMWWLHNVKKLRFSTVSSYIASLSTIYKLKGQNCYVFNSFPTKTALKGIRNLDEINLVCQKPRNVFTFSLLKILGHQISQMNWLEDSKRLFWAVSVILFFGSFRISEILSNQETFFDPLTTLLWKDVVFFENSVRIFIKLPKIFVPGGISVDLFAIQPEYLCPVTVLKTLKMYKQIINPDQNLPVFMFNNKKCMTPSIFNKTLRSLLEPIVGPQAKLFSSHSFRAAIPAALANHPNIAAKEAVMGWGRWESKAFERYTRLKYNKRKETFEDIWSVLNV
jgi:hypothetical protein